jgi:predicted nuclease of predicted toxin-antitoxin system
VKLTIPFFTDHNVPDSTGNAITAAGHQLTRLRECMLTDSKDPVIAIACAEAGQVLVSHDNDFRELSKRLKLTKKDYQRRLHRIDLRCPEPDGARRIAEAMSLIEHEWALAKSKDRPMVIAIRDTSIWIPR